MHRKNFSYLRLWIFLFFLLLIPSGQNIFASIASATKPLLAQKPASGAEEQIQPVFVWDVATKTLYSCRVQRQIFQNCTLGIPFDPSGYIGPLGLGVGFLAGLGGYSAYKASKEYDAAHARDACDSEEKKIG